MSATRNNLTLTVARADALFVSWLQRSENPSARQVRLAVAAAVRRFGDQGCAARVAQEFGEHPDLATARMRWARQTVTMAFGASTSRKRRPPRPSQQPAGRAA